MPDYRFEKRYLQPLYEQIRTMWESEGIKIRLGFEPWMGTSTGIASDLTFKYHLSIFSPHYYDPLCHEGVAYQKRDKKWMGTAIKIKAIEASDLKSPAIYGEFGISPGVKDYLSYISDFADFTDRYLMGWTYYAYDKTIHDGFGIIDSAGNEQDNLKSLVRIYPQKIAGINPRWGIKDSVFSFEFDAKDPIGTTVLALPERFDVDFKTETGSLARIAGIGYYRPTKSGHQKMQITFKLRNK